MTLSRSVSRTPPSTVTASTIVTSQLDVRTTGAGFFDITSEVAAFLREAGAQEGAVTAFIRHTSASLTIQENADPSVLDDLTTALDRLAPQNAGWTHDTEGPDDMPGHIKHRTGDTFTQVYLSYLDKPVPAAEFREDFAPDARYLYRRKDGAVPGRMIRAYQVRRDGKPGPWLAGMTLEPAAVSEAWCHQRGYVCLIQELHRRKVRAGETFGAAYVVGWFDDVAEMNKVYDRHKGKRTLVVADGKFRLE